ncbi:MAG: hypothetical protein PHE60_07580 [Sulfurospirillaceae bacterium]|nr:hypothetical protein [Sulfurospirillaceae bacterium]
MSELAALYVGIERRKTIDAIAKAGLEGLALSSLFRYAKIKGNVLFFVFKHQTAKFEFAYKKEDIKAKMRGYYSLFKEDLKANNVLFNTIEACVIAEPKKEPVTKSTVDFKEQSRGEFEIACSDPALRALFKDIQKTIKERA